MSFRSRRIYVVFVLAVAMLVITVVLFRNTAMYRHDYVTNPLLRDGLDHVRTKVFFPDYLDGIRGENAARVAHWLNGTAPIPFPKDFPHHTSVYLNYGPPAATMDWKAIRNRCKEYNDIQTLEDYECRAERFHALAKGQIVELISLNGFAAPTKNPQLVLRLKDNSVAYYKPCTVFDEQAEAEVIASHLDDLFGFHRANTVVMRNITVTFLESLVLGTSVQATFMRSVLATLRDVCAFENGEVLVGALISGWHDVQATVTLAKKTRFGIDADEVEEFAVGDIEPLHPLEVVTQNHFMFSMLEVFRKLTKNEFCTAQQAVIAAQPETKTVMPWHKPVNVSQINVEGEHHPYPVVSSAQRKEAFGSQKHLYTAEGIHRTTLPHVGPPPPPPPCTLITMDLDRSQFYKRKLHFDERVTFCILCVMDDPTYQTIQHWYIHKYMNNGTSSLSHMLRVSLSYDPLGIFFHPDEQGIVEKRLTLAFECLQQNCDFYTGVKRL